MVGHIISGRIRSSIYKNMLKGYIPGQLLFERDTIILLKLTVDWELIYQRKQMQINKYNYRKSSKIFDHGNKVGDKVILDNNAAYK